MSDEKPGREDDAALTGPEGVSDAELTDEQLDAEAPGVDDAAELEAAEDEVAADAAEDEDKVVAELRKVIWPGRRELVTYTTVVIIFVAFIVALVAGLDLLFAKGVLAVFG